MSSSPTPPDAQPAVLKRSLHILVVEDHTALARNIARLLQLRGHRTVLVPNRDRAVERAMEHSFDLLISDCSFSVDGRPSLANDLRSLQPHLRAIAVSGFSTDRESRASTGFDLHIVRPTRMAEIDEAILRLFPDVPPPIA